MKKTTLLLAAILGFVMNSYSQQVKEKDILGTWKLVIDIEEELKKEAEASDNLFEETIIKMVSGFVDGIVDGLNIYFDFEENNKVLITVNAYGEREVEEAKWFINDRGYLEIDDIKDRDKIKLSGDDNEWKLVDGLLIENDRQSDERTVYMTRVN